VRRCDDPTCRKIVWPLSHHVRDGEDRVWHMACWERWRKALLRGQVLDVRRPR